MLMVVAVNLGSIHLSYAELFRGLFFVYNEKAAIIFDLRFPRIMVALLAGAAFAVSGVLFQAVMKSPLADPGIIGISSGAGLAAAITVILFPAWLSFTPVFAFAGGVLAFLLVYGLSCKSKLAPLRFILAGIAVSAVFTGLLEAVNILTGGTQSAVSAMIRASISMKTWSDVQLLFCYTAVGIFLAFFFAKSCNLLSLEDRTVQSLGVSVGRIRFLTALSAVLLASVATAVAGPVNFVGLIVPHMGRLMVGYDHKVLIPFSILLGSFTMLAADTIGRGIAYPYEIPASIVMSVIGGPFFIFLLLRREGHDRN